VHGAHVHWIRDGVEFGGDTSFDLEPELIEPFFAILVRVKLLEGFSCFTCLVFSEELDRAIGEIVTECDGLYDRDKGRSKEKGDVSVSRGGSRKHLSDNIGQQDTKNTHSGVDSAERFPIVI